MHPQSDICGCIFLCSGFINLNIYQTVTNNKNMSEAAIYIAAIGFAICIFPIHIYNYIYINTADKYASFNAGIYKFNFYNANTVKDKPNEMQINGKSEKINPEKLKSRFYRIFNQLCIYKIIQLGDYGVMKEENAYVVLAQYGLTTAMYKFLQMNGNYCKLRNYTVINCEHSAIRYYAKAVTIINLLVISKIVLIIILEKLHELKNKKK